MIVVVGEMGQKRPAGTDPDRRRQGFLKIHVSGMTRRAEGIQHHHVARVHRLNHRIRHFLAIGQISHPRAAALGELKASGGETSVGQVKRRDRQVADFKRSGDDPWIRMKIALGNRPAIEGIRKDPPQGFHRRLTRVHRERTPAQITHPPAIIQSHDVIRVGVGDEDGIEIAQAFAQHLRAKIRRGVDDQPNFRGFQVQTGPQPVIPGIGQIRLWVLFSNDRNPLGSTRAQEAERKRHCPHSLPCEKTHWQLAIRIRESIRAVLVTLRIKNLALVSDLTVELGPGLNVITGETGAGKSVILGGLNLVLGQRADRGSIRAGADVCSVEAVFDISSLQAPLAAFLESNGLEPCDGGQLLLKRTFTATGTNRQFINGTPTTLATLATVGDWLVDLHGPHDHQSLLQPLRQLILLDAFGGLEAKRIAYSQHVDRATTLTAERVALIVDDTVYAAKLDLLRFQVRELSDAKLDPDEEAAVEAEFTRCSNAARLLELTQSAVGTLSDNDDALLTQSGNFGRILREIHRLDPAASGLESAQESIARALRELQTELSSYADRIDLDPARLAVVETRLNLLQDLKRKYGGSVVAAIERLESARAELQALEGREAELERIDREQAALAGVLKAEGEALSRQRAQLPARLNRAVEKELGVLGFRQSRFEAHLQRAPSSSSGIDAVDFQFAPNPGEPARPLRAIASSGELARVMLALKTVLAAEDEIPVLVFDEVDANVGGETATAVGQKMRQIAQHRQVLCITHLAPVAAHGTTHLVVTKEAAEGRTVSRIHQIKGEDRTDELARMLGGITPASRRHAQELLNSAAAVSHRR